MQQAAATEENLLEILGAISGNSNAVAAAIIIALPGRNKIIRAEGVAFNSHYLPADADVLRWFRDHLDKELQVIRLQCLPVKYHGSVQGWLCTALSNDEQLEECYKAAMKLARYEAATLAALRKDEQIHGVADATQQLTDSVFGATQQPAVVFNAPEGLITNVNSAFENFARMPLEDLIGKSLWALSAFRNPVQLLDSFKEALHAERPSYFRLEHADGDILFASMTVRMVSLDAACAFIADDTNYVQMQKNLVSAEKRAVLQRIARKLVHDLKNPLTTMFGFAQLMVDRRDLPAEIRDDLKRIVAEGEKCRNRLREFAQVFSELHETHEKMKLHEIARDVIRHHIDARYFGLPIHRDIAADLPPVEVHNVELHCIIEESLTNAVATYAERGKQGPIYIRCYSDEEGMIVIEVEDLAGGAEYPQQVFEPFYTTHPSPEHSGLGLTLVKAIAEGINGSAYFENTDEGSRLTVKLPVGGA